MTQPQPEPATPEAATPEPAVPVPSGPQDTAAHTHTPALLGRRRSVAVLDLVVSLASRRPHGYFPDSLTVTAHTPAGRWTAEGRITPGESHPAPGIPELLLPTYHFPLEDLTALVLALTEHMAAASGTLRLTVTAPVHGWDLDDAYAWTYDRTTDCFAPTDPDTAYELLHDDIELPTPRRPLAERNVPYHEISALTAATRAYLAP